MTNIVESIKVRLDAVNLTIEEEEELHDAVRKACRPPAELARVLKAELEDVLRKLPSANTYYGGNEPVLEGLVRWVWRRIEIMKRNERLFSKMQSPTPLPERER